MAYPFRTGDHCYLDGSTPVTVVAQETVTMSRFTIDGRASRELYVAQTARLTSAPADGEAAGPADQAPAGSLNTAGGKTPSPGGGTATHGVRYANAPTLCGLGYFEAPGYTTVLGHGHDDTVDCPDCLSVLAGDSGGDPRSDRQGNGVGLPSPARPVADLKSASGSALPNQQGLPL